MTSRRPNRRRKTWWHGITPAGLIAMLTAAVCALGFTAVACWRYAQGDVDGGNGVALQASSTLAILVAMQARNRPDPAATVEQPASVTTTTTSEVVPDP